MVSQSGCGFEQVDGIVFLNNNETKPETTPNSSGFLWFMAIKSLSLYRLPCPLDVVSGKFNCSIITILIGLEFAVFNRKTLEF